jgi:hypothetical protein
MADSARALPQHLPSVAPRSQPACSSTSRAPRRRCPPSAGGGHALRPVAITSATEFPRARGGHGERTAPPARRAPRRARPLPAPRSPKGGPRSRGHRGRVAGQEVGWAPGDGREHDSGTEERASLAGQLRVDGGPPPRHRHRQPQLDRDRHPDVEHGQVSSKASPSASSWPPPGSWPRRRAPRRRRRVSPRRAGHHLDGEHATAGQLRLDGDGAEEGHRRGARHDPSPRRRAGHGVEVHRQPPRRAWGRRRGRRARGARSR